MNVERGNQDNEFIQTEVNQEEVKAMIEIEEISYQEMIIHDEGRVTVILPKEAYQWARIFAAKQDDVESGKRVYLNTLAVYAVSFFLERSGIETDLEGSDCWYPNPMTPFDVADLLLPDLGQVECRPVLPKQRHIEIPEDARTDRLAYVAVQFGEVLDRVILTGAICGKILDRNSLFLREFNHPDYAISNLPLLLQRSKRRNENVRDDDVLSRVEIKFNLSSRMETILKLEQVLLLESEPSLQRFAIKQMLKAIANDNIASKYHEVANVLGDDEEVETDNNQSESAFEQMAADVWQYLQD